eukprot:360043-Amphidinium_carterae.1
MAKTTHNHKSANFKSKSEGYALPLGNLSRYWPQFVVVAVGSVAVPNPELSSASATAACTLSTSSTVELTPPTFVEEHAHCSCYFDKQRNKKNNAMQNQRKT